ncbi:MAG TPA: hypothetical protein VF622_15470 [Segetibacter sp.]|jgi:protein TonB
MSKCFIVITVVLLCSNNAICQLFIKNYSCTRIETAAKFKDGINGWNKYLQQNITISIPQINCAPPGTYNVEVFVVVNRDGSLTGKPVSAYGYGMESELIRVIQNSPKWIPATSNGRLVIECWCQSFTYIVNSAYY